MTWAKLISIWSFAQDLVEQETAIIIRKNARKRFPIHTHFFQKMKKLFSSLLIWSPSL